MSLQFRMRFAAVLVIVSTAGCSGGGNHLGFGLNPAGFPKTFTICGVMLLGVVVALGGWLYYRSLR